jgi:thiamine biosynthesis lipoprotein
LPPASDSVRRARPLLGTFVEITVADASATDMHAAVEAAFLAVAEVHRLMSFHDPHSDVSRLNGKAWQRAVSVHDWTFQVLQAALDLHRRSRGVFDIAIAPVLQDMGLLPRLKVDRSSSPEKFATGEAVELLPDNCVRFKHPGARIDLGGIAKGFAVDRAIDVLRDHGMPRGLVNAGGDLAAFGPHPETICIRDPRDPRRLLLRIEIDNQALASSGHFFDPFRSASALGSAIIDPCTRKPAQTNDAATVRAPSCMVADALTKVVMVAGPSATALLEHCCASALVVSAAGDVQMTSDLQNAVCLAA